MGVWGENSSGSGWWRAAVNSVLNIRVPSMAPDFFRNWVVVSVSGRNMLNTAVASSLQEHLCIPNNSHGGRNPTYYVEGNRDELTNSKDQNLFYMPVVTRLVKKFTFKKPESFIPVVMKARRWNVLWFRWPQSTFSRLDVYRNRDSSVGIVTRLLTEWRMNLNLNLLAR